MTSQDLITLFRAQLGDENAPYLVSDETALLYLNEAQVQACRRGHLLMDASTYSVNIGATNNLYSLDAKVIQVRRAKAALVPIPLQKRSYRDLDEMRADWLATTPSKPLYFYTDMESGKIGFWPRSSVSDTVQLTVVREPLLNIVLDLTPAADETLTPEIPARYHAGLIDWMLYRAYKRRDPDLLNPAAAAEHLALFAQEFGQPNSALNETFEERNYPFDNYDGSY